MNYSLIKLSFDTAVHFGSSDFAQSLSSSEDHILADRLFSALCHTALQSQGEEELKKLCSWVQEGSLILSDTMPWEGEEYYLPKPLLQSESQQNLPSSKIKAMKRLNWISVSSFAEFSDFVKGSADYDPDQHKLSFGFRTETTKAAVTDGEDAVPYQIGLFQFNPDCGLYFLAGTETLEQKESLEFLTRSLGLSGVGGNVSRGYGKFHVEDVIDLDKASDAGLRWLYDALKKETVSNLLLAASLPAKEELTDDLLEKSSYQLVRRSGFAASNTYAETPLKKKTQYFLCAGSVLPKRFEGELYRVDDHGGHPIYRYGKPMFLGVELR